MPRIVRPDPKKITDYFKPKAPASLKECRGSLTSKYSFATIIDLPNELLSILDYFRWGSDYYYILRRLDLVCKKFSLVFLPFVLTSYSWSLPKTQEIKENKYGTTILDFKHIELYGNLEIYEDLFQFCKNFSNVMTLRLHQIQVNYHVLNELAGLPQLTSLSYDSQTYIDMGDEFSLFPAIGPKKELAPSSLRSITATYEYHSDHSEFPLFIHILKSSANTLISVDVDFKNKLGCLPEAEMGSLHLPLLKHLGLYNVEYNRDVFNRLYSAHSDHLVDVEIYTRHPENQEVENYAFNYMLDGEDTFLTSHLPAMEGVSEMYEVWGFAMQLQRDSLGKLSANDISLIAGDWFLVPAILKANPCLRALSMWGSGYPHWAVREGKNLSSSVEILRLSVGPDEPDLWDPVDMPMFYCDSEYPNPVCKCPGCVNNVFTAEGRRHLQEEWLDTQWHRHEHHVRQMALSIPSLRLVEWFFGLDLRAHQHVAVPFWRWTIERGHDPKRPKLKRELCNWRTIHPFCDLTPWTFTRGMSSKTLEEEEEDCFAIKPQLLVPEVEAQRRPERYMPPGWDYRMPT